MFGHIKLISSTISRDGPDTPISVMYLQRPTISAQTNCLSYSYVYERWSFYYLNHKVQPSGLNSGTLRPGVCITYIISGGEQKLLKTRVLRACTLCVPCICIIVQLGHIILTAFTHMNKAYHAHDQN